VGVPAQCVPPRRRTQQVDRLRCEGRPIGRCRDRDSSSWRMALSRDGARVTAQQGVVEVLSEAAGARLKKVLASRRPSRPSVVSTCRVVTASPVREVSMKFARRPPSRGSWAGESIAGPGGQVIPVELRHDVESRIAAEIAAVEHSMVCTYARTRGRRARWRRGVRANGAACIGAHVRSARGQKTRVIMGPAARRPDMNGRRGLTSAAPSRLAKWDGRGP